MRMNWKYRVLSYSFKTKNRTELTACHCSNESSLLNHFVGYVNATYCNMFCFPV